MKKFPVSRILIGAYTLLISVGAVLLGRLAPMDWTIIAASSGLVMMISAWLGLDLSGALSRSFDMPKGRAERIDITRYVFSLLMLLMMAAAVVLGSRGGRVNDNALAILVAAIALVLAFWIASRKALKLAKSKGASNESQNDPAVCSGVILRGGNDGNLAGAGEPQAAGAADSGFAAAGSSIEGRGVGANGAGCPQQEGNR